MREGFKGYTPTVEGFIAAKSYLLKNAFEGVAPDLVINPAFVKLSYGVLALPGNVTAVPIANNNIQFNWDVDHITDENKYDQVMLLAYDIEHRLAHKRLTGELRKTGVDTLKLHVPEGNTYQLYMAFVAADRSAQSDSIYLGSVTI